MGSLPPTMNLEISRALEWDWYMVRLLEVPIIMQNNYTPNLGIVWWRSLYAWRNDNSRNFEQWMNSMLYFMQGKNTETTLWIKQWRSRIKISNHHVTHVLSRIFKCRRKRRKFWSPTWSGEDPKSEHILWVLPTR